MTPVSVNSIHADNMSTHAIVYTIHAAAFSSSANGTLSYAILFIGVRPAQFRIRRFDFTARQARITSRDGQFIARRDRFILSHPPVSSRQAPGDARGIPSRPGLPAAYLGKPAGLRIVCGKRRRPFPISPSVPRSGRDRIVFSGARAPVGRRIFSFPPSRRRIQMRNGAVGFFPPTMN